MMDKQLSMLVVGEDILKTNGKLAGILLDTQNLSSSMTRDAEAVQLLSVASAPNYRNTLYDQLVQDQRDNDLFESLCTSYGKPPSDINWDGGAPTEHRGSGKVIVPSDNKKRNDMNDARQKKVSPISGKPTPSPVQTLANAPAKPNNDASHGKNRNFFAKLFGFGSK